MADAIKAECPACGERRFRAERDAPEPRDVLTCEACGLKLTYAFLRSRMEQAPDAPAQGPPAAAEQGRAKLATRGRKARRKRR